MSTFVSVGNATQPFRRLLDGVASVVNELPAPVFVQSGSAPFCAGGCESTPFLTMDEFERRVGESTLLILHAGAGSLITALRCRKVPVVMPRRARFGEHVDDHQVELARAFAREGRIVVADAAADLLAAAREALARQSRAPAKPPAPAMVELVADALRRCAAR